MLPNEVSLLFDIDGQTEPARPCPPGADAAAAAVRPPDDPSRLFAKRVQDLVLGSLALLAAAPLMLLIAMAVKLDSPGPVFFRQRRHGFNNEAITVWKFRSMRREATDPTPRGRSRANDERVTRVGRFIRATSLDELPQLFNVLRGEMSLVGPRPHAIGMKTGDAESARLVAEYAHRHRMKPGHHRLGRHQGLARAGRQRRRHPPPGGAGRGIYRAPVVLAGPLYPGHDRALPDGRRQDDALTAANRVKEQGQGSAP